MFITPVDPGQLLPSSLALRALAWAEESGGRLNRGDQDVISHILSASHLSMVRSSDRPPALFYVGAKSPAAAVFGEDWAASATGSEGIPDTEAEAACNRAYFSVAASARPETHICRAGFVDRSGRETELFYFRLLLPVEAANGARLVLCCADLIRSSN